VEAELAALPDSPYRLLEQPSLPRAWAGVPRPVGLRSAVLEGLRREPGLAARAPLVEGQGPLPADLSSPGEVRVLGYAAERVTLQADLSRPALVVLNDQVAPGWTAEVDGQPAPLGPANLVARGVPAPAGRHRVTLSYRAPGLTAGALASLLTLALLLALGGSDYFRSRRRKMASASTKNAAA
jgi:hypothetical protein